jgi:hypothetical protein
VHIALRLQGEASWALVVSDTGPGLPSHADGDLFARFTRGEGEMGDGTGLGLSITRDLVVAMGGTLSIRDREQGGTEARVCLPLRAADPVSMPRVDVFPPAAALQDLRAAAQRGDMVGLEARCRDLRDADPSLGPFTEQALALIAQFDDESLSALFDQAPDTEPAGAHHD